MGWLITLAVLTAIAMIPLGVSLRYEDGKFVFQIKAAFLQFSLPKKKEKEEKPSSADKKPEEEKQVLPEPENLSPAEQKLEEQQSILKQALQARKEAKQAEKEAKKAEKEAIRREKELRKKLQNPAPAEKVPEKPAENPTEKPKRDLKAYLPFVRIAIDFLGSLKKKLRIDKLCVKVILAGDDPCDLACTYGYANAAAGTLLGQLNRIFVIKDQNVEIQCDFTAEKIFYSARMDLTLTVGRILSLGLCYGIRALKEFLIFKKRKGGAAI